MKSTAVILFASVLALPLFAGDAATNAAPEKISAALTLSAFAATVTAPLVCTNGILSQPETTDLGGGKAVFTFAVTNAGNYLITAQVNAPDDSANSFFINVDAPPEDPAMIWDITATSGFEERTVSWRGNGDAENDQFVPKKFQLSAGSHKVILVGREPAQLKSLTVKPAAD